MRAHATTTITNLTGMHALTATKFAQKAATFQSDITLEANDKTCNAQSTVELLSRGIIYQTEVLISADGDDAKQAVAALKAMIDSQFGEENYD